MAFEGPRPEKPKALRIDPESVTDEEADIATLALREALAKTGARLVETSAPNTEETVEDPAVKLQRLIEQFEGVRNGNRKFSGDGSLPS